MKAMLLFEIIIMNHIMDTSYNAKQLQSYNEAAIFLLYCIMKAEFTPGP